MGQCRTRLVFDAGDENYYLRSNSGYGRVRHDTTTNELLAVDRPDSADLSGLVGVDVAVRYG